MRDESRGQHDAFSYVTPEGQIPKSQPVREVRDGAGRALEPLLPLFEDLHEGAGCPSSCQSGC